MSTEPLSPPDTGNTELYQRLGQLTRQLHDTLSQLGVMPRLAAAAHELPDARSRLNYIATKTAEAAHRVLNSVDAAKATQSELQRRSKEMARLLAQPVDTLPVDQLQAYVRQVQAGMFALDNHLTDIMMAQDFHDLTGQVVGKVLLMANELEDSLVKLLVQAAPAEVEEVMGASSLQGPVVDPSASADVVTSQNEVDDLLSSLGF